MPRTNTNGTNGNGQKPTATTGEGFDNYISTDSTASQSTSFQLNADATIGQLLNASDQDYAAFVNQLKQGRSLKIKQRAREVANLLNPQLQMEEIMCEAQHIVDVETAGISPTGQTLPSFRLMGGS